MLTVNWPDRHPVNAAMAELATLPAKGISRIIIDIGANLDPIQSPGNDTLVLAIEPVVHAGVRRRPRLLVMPAAVSDSDGVAKMSVYLSRGGASRQEASFLSPALHINGVSKTGSQLPVPLLSASRMFASIPKEMSVVLLKTDAQNHDFSIVRATGDALRRVRRIKNEVDLKAGVAGGYVNQSNDICNDFMPYMSRRGFVLTCLITGRHSQQIVLARNPEHLEAFCSRRQRNTGTRWANTANVAGTNRSAGLPRWWGDAYWTRHDLLTTGSCDPCSCVGRRALRA